MYITFDPIYCYKILCTELYNHQGSAIWQYGSMSHNTLHHFTHIHSGSIKVETDCTASDYSFPACCVNLRGKTSTQLAFGEESNKWPLCSYRHISKLCISDLAKQHGHVVCFAIKHEYSGPLLIPYTLPWIIWLCANNNNYHFVHHNTTMELCT